MILVPHNPAWADEFAALAAVYSATLGGLVVRIEHVGSTAVPTLRAKPILDIDLVIGSEADFPRVVAALRTLGYAHNGNQGIEGREAFKPIDDNAPLTSPARRWMAHHLYVCPADSRELRRHLIFRDALRQHANLRNEYESRKLAIAERSHGDRRVYAQLKESECRDFIERVIAEADNEMSPA